MDVLLGSNYLFLSNPVLYLYSAKVDILYNVSAQVRISSGSYQLRFISAEARISSGSYQLRFVSWVFHVIFSFVHFISLYTLGGLHTFRKPLPYNMYLFNLRIANHILVKIFVSSLLIMAIPSPFKNVWLSIFVHLSAPHLSVRSNWSVYHLFNDLSVPISLIPNTVLYQTKIDLQTGSNKNVRGHVT